MKTLKEQFEEVRGAVNDESQHVYHYPLLEIMRAANPDGSTAFNKAALKSHGIDPNDFRASWATGYAKETLSHYSDSRSFFTDVTISRCRTCLDESVPDALGHALPDPVKQRIATRLEQLERLSGPGPHIGS